MDMLSYYKRVNHSFLTLMLLAFKINAQVTPPAPYTAGIQVNYVRSWSATAPESNPNTLITRSLKDVKQTTQYLDGLGRPLQAVIKQGSYPTNGTAVDMINMVAYDGFSREQFKYLPSPANSIGGNSSISDGNFKLNPFAQQAAFYSSSNSASPLFGQGETYFYSQINFEPSPMNRVQEEAAAGNSWAGTMSQTLETNRRSIKNKYWFNTTNDGVRKWVVTNGQRVVLAPIPAL